MPEAQTLESMTASLNPAPPATPAANPPKPSPAARQYRLKEMMLRADVTGYVNTQWQADIVADHPFSEVLKPEYWSVVAYKLKTGDKISCYAEDNSFYAELLVRDRDHTWAKVHLLQNVVFDAAGERKDTEDPDYEIRWKGRIQKHAIVRKSDNSVIMSGYSAKLDAMAALAEYRRTLRR